MTDKKIEKEFFNKLAEELENHYPKGERCECGKRLSARSKALIFNAYANIYLKEALSAQKKETISRIKLMLTKIREDKDDNKNREYLKGLLDGCNWYRREVLKTLKKIDE